LKNEKATFSEPKRTVHSSSDTLNGD